MSQRAQTASDSSNLSPPARSCKSRPSSYSPLRIGRFLSPPKIRKSGRKAKLPPSKSARPKSLSKAKSRALRDEEDDDDTLANYIDRAINGPVVEAHSDKEMREGDTDCDRGRLRNRYMASSSTINARKGPSPSSKP